MILTSTSSEESFCIKENTFFILKNVKSYLPSKKTYSSVEITYFQTQTLTTPKHIYFLIDSPSHMAVGHWFFESAIFLPYLKEIQDRFPNIIIHLLEKKMYKLQLLDYFGYSTNVSYELLEEDNLCIIPAPIQSLHVPNHFDLFTKNVENFYTFCNFPTIEKDCAILIMPRQKKENYAGNDRSYDKQFQQLQQKMPDAKVFHTDLNEHFIHQVIQVRNSKQIYLSDGSAFLLNAFIANNSEIFVVDRLTLEQSKRFNRYKFLLDFFHRHNIIRRL